MFFKIDFSKNRSFENRLFENRYFENRFFVIYFLKIGFLKIELPCCSFAQDGARLEARALPMHWPYPSARAAATAATTSTTTTTTKGTAAEMEWTKRVLIVQGTARIQTPTSGWWVAFSLMASHQLVPTTTSARPTPEASAQTPTTKAPTHSLKVYMY